jgi:hypothetical protein
MDGFEAWAAYLGLACLLVRLNHRHAMMTFSSTGLVGIALG